MRYADEVTVPIPDGRPGLPGMLRRARLIIAIAAGISGFSIYDLKAGEDALDRTFPGTPLPLPAPSTEQTPRQVYVGGILLSIPRNYLWGAEKTRTSDWTSPSIKVLLPDLTPLTAGNRHCFINYREPCFRDVVTFGVFNDPLLISAAQQLHNLQLGPGLINPEPKLGPCGTTLYEPKFPPKPGYTEFEYFLKTVNGDPEPTLLRCATTTSLHPFCSAHASANGISYYYNFERNHLCEWDAIRTKIDTLLATFRTTS